jgi:uncharacterized protein (DUF1778 family)
MASKRTKRIEIRLKKSEHDCIAHAAAAMDLTLSDYIRKIVLEKCQ